jgi:hypothetical protein
MRALLARLYLRTWYKIIDKIKSYNMEQDHHPVSRKKISAATPSQAVQTKTAGAALTDNRGQSVQLKENQTGLPSPLKNGIEHLSGSSMDDVKVHYGSSKPATLQAHAYAQGNNIHIAPGQEKHLPHEAWHVVQQKQGRVKPTMQLKNKVNVNNDRTLEKEADHMGAKALVQGKKLPGASKKSNASPHHNRSAVAQLAGNAAHATVNAGNFQGGVIPGFGGNMAPHRIPTTTNTEIHNAGGGGTNVTEGSTMTSYPISTRSNAGGSETTDAVRQVSRAATVLYGKKYIAGHLLNNHLGGPGNLLDNITAISSKSNSQHHAGIEKELKQDVANGYIAYYHVDCSERAGYLPGNPAQGIVGTKGMAKSMAASYSLLRVNGNPGNPGDYQPARYLSLNLDPGGVNQTAHRDGAAIHDAEVVHDAMTALFNPFTAAASGVEFEGLLRYAMQQNYDVQQAYHYIINSVGQITAPADRAIVANNLERLLRE